MKQITKAVGRIALVILALVLVVGVTGVLSVERPVQPPETTAHDPELPFIEVDGYRFHADIFGPADAPVVVVLHGGPGMDYTHLLDLEALSDTYRVVFYDQRGAGLSPRVSAEEMPIDRHVADLNDMVTAVAGPDRRVHLVGHSWGAMLGSAYLAAYPNRVDRAVLAEPGFLTREAFAGYMESVGSMTPPITFDTVRHIGKTVFQLPWIRRIDGHERRDHFMAALMGYDYDGDHPLGGYYRDGDTANASLGWDRLGSRAAMAVQELAEGEGGVDFSMFTKGLERFEGPVLLVTGEHNRIIGTDHQTQHHLGLFSNVELLEIANAGHTMFGEQPAESLRVIREFLAR